VKAVKGGALLFSTYSRAKERFVVSLQSRAAAWLIQVALEDNLWSMCAQFGRGPGCTLHDENGVLWLNTPIPVPLWNIVLRCCADTDADRAIDRVFAHFRARATPFVWLVHPSARPADLKARLERRGFAEVEPVVGMVMELKAPLLVPKPPPGVEVHSVTPASDLPSYVEFVTAGWPVPAAARAHLRLIAETFRIGAAGSPNRAWIATAGGVAVAKVFAHDSAGVVGLYGVTTRPASQGLGLGRLLCTTALADAQRRGHTLAVSHSTPTAAPLYRNIGFREVAAFSIFGHKGHEEH
jgi:GNAT superfamily N-acetyltransferase